MQISKTTYFTCLWPGLARTWWAGSMRSFGWAILFAICLNSLVYLSLNPLLGPGEHVLILGWVLIVSWWGAAIHSAWLELPLLLGMAVRLTPATEVGEAQTAFLKRDYVSTESIIGKILATRPHDPVVQLLLASTYRQTGRLLEARGLLLSLQSDPAALAWQFEIQADLARLDHLEKTTDEDVSSSPEVESKPRVVKASSADEPSTNLRKVARRKAA